MMIKKGEAIAKGHRKKIHMVGFNLYGFVEDVYGTNTSFNLYRWLSPLISVADMKKKTSKDYAFVKSCYKRRTALRILDQLGPRQPKPKQLR